jgi:hypothetical protein
MVTIRLWVLYMIGLAGAFTVMVAFIAGWYMGYVVGDREGHQKQRRERKRLR